MEMDKVKILIVILMLINDLDKYEYLLLYE